MGDSLAELPPARLLTPGPEMGKSRGKVKRKESPKSRDGLRPSLGPVPLLCSTRSLCAGRIAAIAVRPSLWTALSVISFDCDRGGAPLSRLCPLVIHHPSSYPSRCKDFIWESGYCGAPPSHVSVFVVLLDEPHQLLIMAIASVTPMFS